MSNKLTKDSIRNYRHVINTLYEMITNKKAFNYNNLNELINEKKSDNLLISYDVDDISDDLEIIFYKMINSRYNNVTEVKNDLILWKNSN